MARASAGESALHKHLRVLETFTVHDQTRTLGEIASVAGLAPSTAHRLVTELVNEGLLERAPGHRAYRLGLRLWELASRTPGPLGIREIARPWLDAVQSRLRQHTQLSVLSGHDVLFIERLSHRDAVVNAVLVGGRIALPLSASGLVLLAHADAALVDEIVADGWPHPTRAALSDEGELRAALAHVRARGYAASGGHIYPGSRGIAVPVRGPHGAVYAALGAVVPDDGSPDAPVVEVLTFAASGIRRALEQAYLPSATADEALAVGDAFAAMSAASRAYFVRRDAAANLGARPAADAEALRDADASKHTRNTSRPGRNRAET